MKKLILFSYLAIMLFFSACSFEKDLKTLAENEGIFYVLETQDKARSYLWIKKIEDNFEVYFRKDDEVDFAWAKMKELQTNAFTLNDAKSEKIYATAMLEFKDNEPTLKLEKDGQNLTFKPTPIKINHLLTLNSTLIKEKEDIKLSISDEKIFFDESLKLTNNTRKKLNEALALGANTLKELEEKLKSSQLSFYETKKDDFITHLEFIKNDMIDYIDDTILVVSTQAYNYEGGAHGNQNSTTRIFSLQDGTELSSESKDLFKDKDDENLLKLTLEKLSIQNQTPASAFLQWGEEPKQSLELPQNFTLNSKGVILTYKPYEIAPYSRGFIRVFLSFEELKPFIKKDSALAYLFER